MGCAIVNTGGNAMLRGFSWLGNLGTVTTRLFNGWAYAIPTAPPSMPQCRAIPSSSDVCAIYYILTFTLFAGPLGSLIMPLAALVVDVFTLTSFIRLVRAILVRLAEMNR
jgi:hypothetical protein